MLRVVVDGRALYSHHSRYRGIGRYLADVLAELATQPDMRVSVLAEARTSMPGAVDMVRVHRWAPERSPFFAHTFERLSLWEHVTRLPGEISRAGAEVFHSPATEPPTRCPVPWVQTVHDVPLVGFGSDQAEIWRQRMAPARLAGAVIANSRRTADDATRVLDLDPNRVRVIYHGVSPKFMPPPERRLAGRTFILYVGQWGPHKGYPEAFETVARIAAAGLPHSLKVAGWLRPDFRVEVGKLVASSGRPDRIELLDFVPDPVLVSLYQRAAAVVVTSRHEGFGFPALEAMACGSPLVAFNNSSLDEVIGEAGLLVEDGDVSAMVSALERVLSDHKLWERLSDAGLARARRFTWAESARAHAAVFSAVAKGDSLDAQPA